MAKCEVCGAPVERAFPVLVVLVAAAGYTFWKHYGESSSTQAWDEYFTALNGMDRTALENVAQKHPGTAPAHWALVTVADMRNIWLRAYIEEPDLKRVKVGQRADLVVATTATPTLMAFQRLHCTSLPPIISPPSSVPSVEAHAMSAANISGPDRS